MLSLSQPDSCGVRAGKEPISKKIRAVVTRRGMDPVRTVAAHLSDLCRRQDGSRALATVLCNPALCLPRGGGSRSPWVAPSRWLSAEERPREAASWGHGNPLAGNVGSRTPSWPRRVAWCSHLRCFCPLSFFPSLHPSRGIRLAWRWWLLQPSPGPSPSCTGISPNKPLACVTPF